MFALGKFLSRFIDFLTVVSGLAIALMMLHITLDVVARNFFNYPLPGTITIVSYYYMAIAAFMPLAFAEQKQAHISVEVVTERLPPWLQKHLAGWMLLFSAAVFALLTVRSWQEAMGKYGIKASIVQGEDSLPVWPTYFVLPLGCCLMFLVVVYKFTVYLTRQPSGLDTERAAPTVDAD
ncbi:MAG: TRAP transporter small permease [Hydrogenophaga sp.]|jgi:TRAP-type C4-dicarboxylate transport system permease small subunit|nr:TRAP transporter small permease [Hydrogenophaga sp.]